MSIVRMDTLSLYTVEYLNAPNELSQSLLKQDSSANLMYIKRLFSSSSYGVTPSLNPPAYRFPLLLINPANLILSMSNTSSQSLH